MLPCAQSGVSVVQPWMMPSCLPKGSTVAATRQKQMPPDDSRTGEHGHGHGHDHVRARVFSCVRTS